MKLWKCDAVGPIEGLLAVQVVVMAETRQQAIEKPLDGKSNDEVTNQDEARFSAILAVNWLLNAGVKPSDSAGLADKLDKQAEDERKKTATMRSAEDVKRLAVRLRRA